MNASEEPPIRCEVVACALCGGTRRAPVLAARDWLTGASGVFHVVRCLDCGHLYECPRPLPTELARLYPPDYSPHRAAPLSGESSPQAGWARRALRAIPGLRAGVRALLANRSTWLPPTVAGQGRALELGCASGGFLEELRRAGWSATGVEPIAAPAERARQKGFDVWVGSLEAAAFSANAFDAAFAWMVIEHLPDPLATLRELHRILQPGAWLAFSVPNAGCWERRVFGPYWYALTLPVHFHHFTRTTLERMLRDTGFDLVRVIPQANFLSVVGSLGIAARARGWQRLGNRLIGWTEDPPTWLNLLLSPAAHLAAAMGQAGRLTIVARRRD